MEKKNATLQKQTITAQQGVRFDYQNDYTWKATMLPGFSLPEELSVFHKNKPNHIYVIFPQDDTPYIKVALWMKGYIANIKYESVHPYTFKDVEIFYNLQQQQKINIKQENENKKFAEKFGSIILHEFLQQKETLLQKIQTTK